MIKFWIGIAIGLVCGGIIGWAVSLGAMEDEEDWGTDDDDE